MDNGAGTRVAVPGRRLGPGRIAAVVLGAAVTGVCIGLGLGVHHLFGNSAPQPVGSTAAVSLQGEATWGPGQRPAPPITALEDEGGRAFSLSSLRGRTVAMVFFDSYCRQECPLAGRALAAAESSLPVGQRPTLVVVSVNPHDTSASARVAVRRWGLAQVGAWHWLRGSHAELARVWKAYHIFVAPPRGGDISHTEALYLIDRRGYERSGYVYPFMPGFVSHDLRLLAVERRS